MCQKVLVIRGAYGPFSMLYVTVAIGCYDNSLMITHQSHSSIVPDHEVSLNSLHQGQGVNLDRPAPPLPQVGTVRVALQLALQLVRVEKLECLRATGSGRAPSAGKVMNFDRELLQVADAAADLVNQGKERCGVGDFQGCEGWATRGLFQRRKNTDLA